MSIGFGGYTHLSSSRPMRTVIDTDIAHMLPKVDIIERSLIDDAVAKYIRNDVKNTKRLVKEINAMANTKFKVGDKVRVVAKVIDEFSLVPRGIKSGDEFTITSVNPNSSNLRLHYGVKESIWIVYEDELELVMPESFTKADLKNGMVVEHRNGYRRLVLNEKFIAEGAHTHFYMYTDDLMAIGDSGIRLPSFEEFDIVKVYDTNGDFITNIFDDEYLKLIWERKEEPKPTHKYKVGDKVKMRSDLVVGRKYGGLTMWEGRMEETIKTHDIVTITGLASDGDYSVDKHTFIISDEMIEGLVDYEEMTVEEIEKKLGYKIKVVADK